MSKIVSNRSLIKNNNIKTISNGLLKIAIGSTTFYLTSNYEMYYPILLYMHNIPIVTVFCGVHDVTHELFKNIRQLNNKKD